MWGCRSSRLAPAARREERVSNKHFFAPRTLSGLLAGAWKGRRLGIRTAQEVPLLGPDFRNMGRSPWGLGQGPLRPFGWDRANIHFFVGLNTFSQVAPSGHLGSLKSASLVPQTPPWGYPPDPQSQNRKTMSVRDFGSIFTA